MGEKFSQFSSAMISIQTKIVCVEMAIWFRINLENISIYYKKKMK